MKPELIISICALCVTTITTIAFGLALFRLNKGKDYALKQSDLVGKMYDNFWVTLNNGKSHLEYHSFIKRVETIIRLMSEKNLSIYNNKAYGMYVEDLKILKDECHRLDLQIRADFRNFRIIMGSYRYFLSKKKKEKLDDLLPLQKTSNNIIEQILVPNAKDLIDIENKFEVYRDELISQYTKSLIDFHQKIEGFIDNAHKV